MENPKQQLIERIKTANNVLVTVSASPSVDQLSSAIGLTLMLNKMGKHATAVFSGQVPSTIEFLEPQKTLETNTDSLRDFIIALDKSKADKLRYKVEDDHVKIFITPYRTSITEKDLDFSQGDFNVEVVVALGVTDPKDLDQAITAHGRILHDATTIAVTTGQQSSLGTINWADSSASSLCEMIASITDTLQANLLDGQMATALMTGIVAETARFSNEKTTQGAMAASAKLMAAGANQQLVASKLQEPTELGVPVQNEPASADAADSHDGSLQINHPTDSAPQDSQFVGELPDVHPEDDQPTVDQINIDENGIVGADGDKPEDTPINTDSAVEGGSSLILEPPSLGGKLTANSEPEQLDPSVDPLAGGDHDTPILTHNSPAPEEKVVNLPDLSGTEDLPGPTMTLPSEVVPESTEAPAEPEPQPAVPQDDFAPQTLSDLEQAVDSPHLEQVDNPQPEEPAPVAPAPASELAEVAEALSDVGMHTTPDVDNARDAISAALAGSNEPLPPIAALNAQPLDLEIKQTGQTGILDHIDEETGIPEFKMPDSLVPPDTDLPADLTATQVNDPTAPPPVPPPMMPGFDNGSSLPPVPGQDQPPQENNGQTQSGNPFNLPPA